MIKKVTRKELAKKAGVSEATVSRAFNQPNSVKIEKREKVISLAKKMGYQPDKHASALRRNGSGTILFLENKAERKYSWIKIECFRWFYGDIVWAISEESENSLYHIRFKTAESLLDIRNILQQERFDGIIGFNFEEPARAEILAESGIPYICAHHTKKLSGFNRIMLNNYKGGYLAGEFFKKTGHKKPVYVSGYLEYQSAHDERYKGFMDALSPITVDLIDINVSLEGGVEAGRKLLKRVKNREIDCIGVVNDLTAWGLIQVFREAGIKIPEDISIIAYDNLPITLSLPFRLASIDLRLHDIYSQAYKKLILQIQTGEIVDEVVDPYLIKGNSVKSN